MNKYAANFTGQTWQVVTIVMLSNYLASMLLKSIKWMLKPREGEKRKTMRKTGCTVMSWIMKMGEEKKEDGGIGMWGWAAQWVMFVSPCSVGYNKD